MQTGSSKTSRIDEWFLRLITRLREEAAKLSEQERKRVSNLSDLSAPCQVEVVWLSNSNHGLDQQVTFITHFPDLPDMEMKVWGPILPWKVIDSFEEILASPKWNRQCPERDHVREATYADVIEFFLLQTLNSFKDNALNSIMQEVPPKLHRVSAQWITHEAFVWSHNGMISELDVEGMVRETIEDAKASARAVPQPERPLRPHIDGWGTYFYPPVWVGELPKETIREKMTGPRKLFRLAWEKALDGEYKGNKVVVNRDGFIVIGVSEKLKALELLNEIMIVALQHGIPVLAIRESELGEATIDPEELEIGGHGLPIVSLRTRQFVERWAPTHPPFHTTDRKVVATEEFIVILREAEAKTASPSKRISLLCLLEAHTHMHNAEYAQCVLMGWVVAERIIETVWEMFLKERDISGKREQKLLDSNSWNLDRILEALSIVGKLPDNIYREAMEVKRKRNSIVHGGQQASGQEAKQCMDLVATLEEEFGD